MAAKKRSAKNSITVNISELNSALSSDGNIFSTVVQKCASKRLIATGDCSNMFDTHTGKTLQSRVADFIHRILAVVSTLPDQLDVFLCILHESDDLLTQNVAKEIAAKYMYPLPQYNAMIAAEIPQQHVTTSNNDNSSSSNMIRPVQSVEGGSVTTDMSSTLPQQQQQLLTSTQTDQLQSSNNEGEEPMESDGLGWGRKSSPLFEYPNSKSRVRGIVLIINNVKFHGKDGGNRDSSNRDVERLHITFTKLNYAVFTQSNLTAHQIIEHIRLTQVMVEHDSFICCILSHGDTQGIKGIDGDIVTENNIINVTNAKCSGKPKLFFIQACRGNNTPEPIIFDGPEPPAIETLQQVQEEMILDGIPTALPYEADYLFSYSTCSGNAAARGIYSGSQYIKTLCDTIDLYSSRHSVDELLLIVSNTIAKNPVKFKTHTYHQMPDFRSTLRGKFYFKK